MENKLNQINSLYINIALSDFILGYKEKKIINKYDIFLFAEHMQGFYPNIPYLLVANMLNAIIDENSNNDNNIDYIFKNQYLGLNKIYNGHFMEIINYNYNKKEINTKQLVYTKQ